MPEPARKRIAREKPCEEDTHPKAHLHARWSAKARVLMVGSLLQRLDFQARLTLVEQGQLPRRIDWDSIIEEISEWVKKQDELHNTAEATLPPEDQAKGRERIMETAKVWTKRFLTTGDIHDDPPHEPGHKVERNKVHLDKIFEMLRKGYVDKIKKQPCTYRSIRHLEKLRPEAQKLREKAFPEGCGLKTIDALWSQLRQRHPELIITSANQKKARATGPVQVSLNITVLLLAVRQSGGNCSIYVVIARTQHALHSAATRLQDCARQLLGHIPVQYPAYHFEAGAAGLYAAQRTRARELPFYWNPEFFQNQWFIDAFTVDPSDIVMDRKGICVMGEAPPIMESQLVNVSVGGLPKVMVYIAVHQKHGVHAFFAYHGAKHGGTADKRAEADMYAGFDFWYERLSPEEKAHIIERNYYNTPESVAAFKKRSSASAFKAFTDGPFHPKHFMVRSQI